MNFYDGMYEAGFDDPQDYLDALEQEYIDYLDFQPREKYVEPEDEGAISSPYFIDYLASAIMRKVKHLVNARFYPKIVSLLDGHKCVIMCVSGTNEETGESYYTEYWPFYEATEKDLNNLPDHVEDFIIRIRVQDRRNTETGEEYLECFQPVTWFSYSKSATEDDVTLSGGKCLIHYRWGNEDLKYTHSQYYLLSRLNSKVTEEDKKNVWIDEFGCTYNKERTKLISCNKELKEYSIRPGTLCICDEAFHYCWHLESLTIPQSVVIIGTRVFELCEQLKNLTIPNSILKLGTHAFYRCENLEEVFFTDDNSDFRKQVDFPDNMFNACKKLHRVHLPNYIRSIGSRMFYECKELTCVNIPDGVKRLGESAFYHCESLETINIPESVGFIDSYCFEWCFKLKDIVFPDDVNYLGNGVLSHCWSLKGVALPKKISEIPQASFEGCSSLESFTIPNSVEKIGHSAFAECDNLTTLIIPSSVKHIGSDAFLGCESITDIELPEGITSLQRAVFRNCYSLKSVRIPSSVTLIEEEVFGLCKSLENIHIPESVEEIDTAAFFDCISLKSVHLPVNLTHIPKLLFNGCNSLQEVYLPKEAWAYGEFLQECPSLQRVYIPHGGSIERYSQYIPERVTIIEEEI